MSLISLFHSLLDTCIFKIMDIYLSFDIWIIKKSCSCKRYVRLLLLLLNNLYLQYCYIHTDHVYTTDH